MERINFKQQRDFGEILGTTFTFVRKNILQLAKFTLVFSAIPLLAGQLLFGQAFSHVFSSGFFLDPGSNPLADSMGQLIIAYVLMVGGILTYYVTVNSYIALYAAGVENISISTVGKEVLRKLPRYFGAAIITTVMIMIAALLFIIPGIYMFVVMI
ncbi:MAG: hypothetical protein IIA45_04780, partial [Bacteroidetes bacterium]|nr:hypothetical protein [Bacteroidota bacterium]